MGRSRRLVRWCALVAMFAACEPSTGSLTPQAGSSAPSSASAVAGDSTSTASAVDSAKSAKSAKSVTAAPQTPPPPARVKLGLTGAKRRRCELYPGARSYLLQVDDAWWEPRSKGFTKREQIAAVMEKEDLDAVFVGRAPIMMGGAPTARHWALDRGWIKVQGQLTSVAPAGASGELWLTSDSDGRYRGFFVDGKKPAVALTRPRLVGPEVPGLSEIGAKACAQPMLLAAAGSESEALALVIECHKDAPRRIAHWTLPKLELREEPLPAELEPHDLLTAEDGTLVVTGTADGKAVAARRDASGRWTSLTSSVTEPNSPEAALDSRGRVWMSGLGRGPDGKDDHYLLREEAGALVRVAVDEEVGGERPSFFAIGSHPDTGLLLRVVTPSSCWLFSERTDLSRLQAP